MQNYIHILTTACCLLLCASCANQDNIPLSRREFESHGTVRLPLAHPPETWDPRLIKSNSTVTIAHLLYEGLLRFEYHDKLSYGIADRIEISDDKTVYTFHLRDSFWSTGEPLTAEDFLRSWKEAIVSPGGQRYSSHFDLIQGAKELRAGHDAELGIEAVDPHTLKVTLAKPTPYFTKLLAAHYFYPVHPSLDKTGNGPFMLSDDKTLTFHKNPLYWDAKNVQIDELAFVPTDEEHVVNRFVLGELEWGGSPVAAIEASQISALKKQRLLTSYPASGVYFLRFNTAKTPFDQKMMRRAFGQAVDRGLLIDQVFKGESTLATGMIPPAYRLQSTPYFEDADITTAWGDFQAALQQMNVSKEDIPHLTLCYLDTSTHAQIARQLKTQWEEAFEINIQLHACSAAAYYDNLREGAFHISLGSWFADVQDPVDFLAIFKDQDDPFNGTYWENEQYRSILAEAEQAPAPEQRLTALASAEQLLMAEMPVAPLFHPFYFSMKKDNLYGVYFSDLGYLDFKYAFLDDNSIDELVSPD